LSNRSNNIKKIQDAGLSLITDEMYSKQDTVLRRYLMCNRGRNWLQCVVQLGL
jgi:hypothetical protein